MFGIFDRLRQREIARIETAEEQYHRLCREIVNGEEPDEAKVEKVITAVGKTVRDLRVDVERIAHRRRLKTEADAADKIRSELAVLESAFAARQTEMQRLQDAFNGEARMFLDRREALSRQRDECLKAKRRLLETAPQHIQDRIEELGRTAQPIRENLEKQSEFARTLRREIEARDKDIAELQRQIGGDPTKYPIHARNQSDAKFRLMQTEQVIADQEAQLKPILDAIAKLEQQRYEVE